jgi:hypothetical protein
MYMKLLSCYRILRGHTSLAACYELGYIAGIAVGALRASGVKATAKKVELN